MTTTIPLFGDMPEAPKPEQFKLVQFQVFNWGTFSDLVTLDIAPRGYLFIGPSGAGKSTLLDAHATLLTPPKWVGFNVAAREGEARGQGADRNLMSYVRGAWGQETGKNGDLVQKHLRESTTWSALAETYRSDRRTVTIAQIFWARGKTTDRREVKRAYLVADRAFDIQELQAFADKDFDLKLVRALPGVHVQDEFSSYSERFRRYMGVDQESALRLLHKTQSAKNLGDINEFLRDFTLEPPETFDIAKHLVEHFQSLRSAHATVVDTRRQIEVLAPARVAYDELLVHRSTLAQLAATRDNLDAYREQLKAQLIQALIGNLMASVAENAEQAREWRTQEATAKASLTLLVGKRNGNALAQVAKCEAELTVAENLLRGVEGTQDTLVAVCELLAVAKPGSEPELQAVLRLARAHLAEVSTREQANQAERVDIRVDLWFAREKLEGVLTELAALARRKSNMPNQLLDVRSRICEALRLDEADVPFVGELVDVMEAELVWKGAAERTLNGFAGHMLVPPAHLSQVEAYVNKSHLGALLTLQRAEPMPARAARKGSLASKLTYSNHVLASWAQHRACALFDHECVDRVEDLAAHPLALTREGLAKNGDSLRKDDRFRIDDRSKWILGGDTRTKEASLQDEADRLTAQVAELVQAEQALAPVASQARQQRQLETLQSLNWAQLDLAAAQRKHEAAQAQLAIAKEAAPDLAALEGQIAQEEAKHAQAQQAASRLEAQNTTLESRLQHEQARLAQLNPALLAACLTAAVTTDLADRFAAHAPVIELDNLDLVMSQVKDALSQAERSVQSKASSRLHETTSQLRDYIRDWPAKSANLDATEASAKEFFELLANLEVDGLPHFEAEFLARLQEYGTSDLMILSRRLDDERKAIRERMEAVNASLRKTEFNKETYLVIEPREKSIPDVMALRQSFKEAFTNHLQDSTPAEVERRFNILNSIVKRLESQDESDKAWRAVCLDVRRHVEFAIREFNAAGEEVDVYRSGAGKSGGQRQKLTAAILAAALRYQLGGKDTGVPMFSTVFMDEAFDKADAEFTDLAMKVFESFGFQLVVATPSKSVMTLEPFIGGACFVHIEKSKHSRVLALAYRDDAKKLDFAAAGVSLETDDGI